MKSKKSISPQRQELIKKNELKAKHHELYIASLGLRQNYSSFETCIKSFLEEQHTNQEDSYASDREHAEDVFESFEKFLDTCILTRGSLEEQPLSPPDLSRAKKLLEAQGYTVERKQTVRKKVRK